MAHNRLADEYLDGVRYRTYKNHLAGIKVMMTLDDNEFIYILKKDETEHWRLLYRSNGAPLRFAAADHDPRAFFDPIWQDCTNKKIKI